MSILNAFKRASEVHFNKKISNMNAQNVQDAIDETMAAVNAISNFDNGVLPVTNGGTGRNSLTSNSFLIGNGSGSVILKTPAEVLESIAALPLSGGTLTGAVNISVDGTEASVISKYDTTNKVVAFSYGIQSLGEDYSVRYCGGKTYIDSAEAIRLRPYDNYYGSLIFGSTSGQLEFRTSQDGYGNVGAASYRFKNVYSANGVSTTSDARLKKNINDDFSRFSEVFANLRPVTFEYSDLNDGKIRFGFIAQEVEAILSEHGYNPNDFAFLSKSELDPESELAKIIGDTFVYSLNYDEFTPWAIAMLQMQQVEIEKSNSKISKLENRVESLEKLLNVSI